jgi:hypothetical protein
MIVIDAYLTYIACTQHHLEQRDRESFDEFIHKLSDELIDWRKNARDTRSTAAAIFSPSKRPAPPSSDVVHLTPTKKLRFTDDSSSSSSSEARLPATCRMKGCAHRSIFVCSHCNNGNQHYCNPHKKGHRNCFFQHCEDKHPGMTVQVSSYL